MMDVMDVDEIPMSTSDCLTARNDDANSPSVRVESEADNVK